MIIGVSGSGKTNSLCNLIGHQPDIDKIYLYAKDPYEAKYQFLINKQENAGLKYINDFEALLNTPFTKILKNTIQIKNVKN